MVESKCSWDDGDFEMMSGAHMQYKGLGLGRCRLHRFRPVGLVKRENIVLRTVSVMR